MFRLRHEIKCNPLRINRTIGDHEDLRGPRNHVDAHLAKYLPLCFRHKSITWPHDFINGLDAFSAVCECCHSLSAANGDNPIDPSHGGSSHYKRI